MPDAINAGIFAVPLRELDPALANVFEALDRDSRRPIAERYCMRCEKSAGFGNTLVGVNHECDPDDLAHLAKYPMLRRRGRVQYLLEDWLQRRTLADYGASDYGVARAMLNALTDDRLLDGLTLREWRYFCWKYMSVYAPEQADKFKAIYERPQGW